MDPYERDDEFDGILRALRDELTQPPSSRARWNHIAAMRRAAPDTPARQIHLKSRALVAVGGATVGLLALTTALAAAGRLPEVAQDRVARVAETVGLNLP